MELERLERIGKYQILGEIGRGTMGRVYKARDPILNRFVAIKTLSLSLGAKGEMHKRFHREAQAVAQLSHPNIVTVHDFGEEQGLIYMAMELLEGTDLRDKIDGGSLKTLDEKLGIMEQVCSGLAFAHAKGVVHRDLKPANIHIQPNGQVKIVDFGLARLTTSEMTQDGIVLGTPNYMSPEQAMGDKVDARSDIFSAGAVFYEVLTGHKPFDADSTPGVLFQVVHKEAPAVRQWAPDTPRILVEVVEKALAKDKTQRFQTAPQMRAALAVAREALESGRGPDASLADESQRALRQVARKDGSVPPLPTSRLGSGSHPGYVAGTVAFDMEKPASRPSLPDTVSGRASTQMNASGRRAPAPSSRHSLYLAGAIGVVGLALAGLAAVAVFWLQASKPAPPSPTASDTAKAEVGALTQALVETQIQLAARDLDDKNYEAAIREAERILKLAPQNAEAGRILQQARGRQEQLQAAVAEAYQALEAGDMQKASQALGRVLELDPRHPAAGELTARLNTVFRSHAEEARRSMGRSRADAERVGAGSSEAFGQAVTLAGQAEASFKKGDFADATRGFLESRDAFDQARRGGKLATAHARKGGPSGLEAAAPAPGSSPAVARAPEAEPTPAPRHFVGGKTQIASAKAGGDLEGFDTSDVRKQKIPDFVGRIEFEASPPVVRAGEPYVVKVYLVNDGKKTIRIKSVTLTTIVNGDRGPSGGSPHPREVAPMHRALVAELQGIWPEAVDTWSLEAVVMSDNDETGTGRLSWM